MNKFLSIIIAMVFVMACGDGPTPPPLEPDPAEQVINGLRVEATCTPIWESIHYDRDGHIIAYSVVYSCGNRGEAEAQGATCEAVGGTSTQLPYDAVECDYEVEE